MKEPNQSRNISERIALVNSMIAYWKSIAERSFQRANPNSDPTEFEREWPKVLDNFFLAETVRTANGLERFLPKIVPINAQLG